MSKRRPASYRFERFQLDATEHQLLKSGSPVAMAPKAFALLLALVENRGHVVTKERLMSLVWPDTFIEENNLAVHISVLRRILGEGSNGTKFIRTIPKRGYSFVADVSESLPQEDAAIPRVSSIAILPFSVSSSESGDEYLGLGMTDAIITRLSQISQIAVRPTSAVARYDDYTLDPLQIGKELAVEAVMSGRVNRSGNRVRVTVQLIHVLENCLLWAEKLDHDFTDVFTYEDLISEHVARALNLKLTGEQIERLTKRHTENSAAYWAYLKGRYHWKKRSPESFKKAIEYFQFASEKDPNFGLAYSGLADCYALLNYYGLVPPTLGMSKAKSAAKQALAADGRLAEAHASLALVKFWHDWDWAGAEMSFQTAIELNPSYATAHQWFCWYLVAMGRFEQSVAVGRRALSLDPTAPAINMALGKSFYFSRRFDDSVQQCEATLELDPEFIPALFFLGQAYEQKGLDAKALSQYEKAVSLTGSFHLGSAVIAHAQARAGGKVAARKILASLLGLHETQEAYVPPHGIALIYLGLGDHERAIDWLEKSFAERFIWLAYLNVDPVFDPLRGEGRFKKLLKLMRFPQVARVQ